jgi:hypothetical protein
MDSSATQAIASTQAQTKQSLATAFVKMNAQSEQAIVSLLETAAPSSAAKSAGTGLHVDINA